MVSTIQSTIQILFEDQDLAVIYKPPGVVVNEADTNHSETIQAWWWPQISAAISSKPQANWQKLVPSEYPTEFGTPEEIFAQRQGIVHRLDKETSGVMVLAKNPGALLHLLHQFQTRQTQKKYQCLVHGKFQVLSDTIELPLARSPWNRMKYAALPTGRLATTSYQVTQFFPGLNLPKVLEQLHPSGPIHKKLRKAYQGFSLVNCWPKTGRTHQIRVHMAHLQHPIVSDETYLGSKRKQLDQIWCPRLFLHAAELSFIHPRTGESVTYTAELPGDLQTALEFLEKE